MLSPDRAAELLGGIAGGYVDPADLLGVPVLAVDADGPGDMAALQVPVLLPAVVVAVSRSGGAPPLGAGGPDIALTAGDGRVAAPWVAAPGVAAPWVTVTDPVAHLADLSARVVAHAAAAVTLVGLLRSAPVGVDAGLAVESMAYSMLQAGPDFARWRAARPMAARGPAARDPAARGPAARGPADPGEAGAAPVLVARTGNRMEITLNRPEVHNAYSRAMRDALCEALAAAAGDPGVEVELSGVGPSFCSGGDLTEFATADDPVSAHLVRTTRSPARLLAGLASRTTVTMHGYCAGSGVELPAFAAVVRARAGTRIWLPELDMGLIPGAGGTVSLPGRIGRGRTAWLALSGEPIGTATALDWGLVDEVL